MARGHRAALFSEAYDGRLDDGERRRFDDHLAACADCASAFATFAAAVDALRALPAASMPQPVRLPQTPPLPARAGLISGLRERLAWRPQALALTLGGLAAAAGVVLAVGALHHGTSSSSTGQPLAAGFAGGTSQAPGSDVRVQPNGAVAPGLPESAFGYAETVPVPGHPDQLVELATTSSTYAAGQQVLILAQVRLAHPASPGVAAALPAGSAVVPDVRLLANLDRVPTANGSPPPAGSAPGDALRGAILQAPPASPYGALAGGQSVFKVTLPTNLARGQVVSLVALLPDAQGQLQVVAILTLTIS